MGNGNERWGMMGVNIGWWMGKPVKKTGEKDVIPGILDYMVHGSE